MTNNEKVLELMNRRQRQLLVHSFLYYQQNTNIISDFTFDKWSKELADLIKDHEEIFKQSVYYNGFQTFDGSSGYDLPYADPVIQSTGLRLLKLHSHYKKSNTL